MGLFDTLRFEKPIICETCGASLYDTQTKCFSNLLKTYQVGDVVDTEFVRTGIINEILFCPHCNHYGQGIWLTLWHSLLSGVYTTEADAETRLLQVDRADILNHLMRHQQQREDLQRKYLELYHTIEGYHDFVKSRDSGKDWDADLRYLSTRLSEFIKDPDILARILDAFKPSLVEEYVGEA